ncbi:hypothetical protein [Methylocapsa sp. S129]|nr:hypothetical protein [Methylocapsa sp. S129]
MYQLEIQNSMIRLAAGATLIFPQRAAILGSAFAGVRRISFRAMK